MLTPETINIAIPTFYLEPGENRLQFVTLDTAPSLGNGDTRRPALEVKGIRIKLRDPRRSPRTGVKATEL
jgi:hypothetical protein